MYIYTPIYVQHELHKQLAWGVVGDLLKHKNKIFENLSLGYQSNKTEQ